MPDPVTGSFTATGQSTSFFPRRVIKEASAEFNVSLWGTFVATVAIERSFNGSTWLPLTNLGAALSFSAPMTEVLDEPEHKVRYRLNCTAFTSGTVNYRISQ